MRLPALSARIAGAHDLPLWPPLAATRGPGAKSDLHAHHAMHFVLAVSGDLRVRASRSGAWQPSAGVLTAPDVVHAIDALGAEVLVIFLDPESDVGAMFAANLTGPFRAISRDERTLLVRNAEPSAIMRADGVEWTRRALETLSGVHLPPRRPIHPRVKKALRILRDGGSEGETSLAALARAVSLSPGRLMHVFTESIGIPLRPYLTWLRLQRAGAAIASGSPLAQAAHAAGFSDAAHMSRTFRRMVGVAPSVLRPKPKSAS